MYRYLRKPEDMYRDELLKEGYTFNTTEDVVSEISSKSASWFPTTMSGGLSHYKKHMNRKVKPSGVTVWKCFKQGYIVEPNPKGKWYGKVLGEVHKVLVGRKVFTLLDMSRSDWSKIEAANTNHHAKLEPVLVKGSYTLSSIDPEGFDAPSYSMIKHEHSAGDKIRKTN